MEEPVNQLPEGSDDRVSRDDIFAQIIGPDKPSRVRMFGDGVNPSDLWGEVPSRSTCNRKVLEQEAKLSKMKNIWKNKINSLQCYKKDFPGIKATTMVQIVAVVSKQSLNSISFIFTGVLHSIDPKTTVGRQALGSNWCEVHVLVVLELEEDLIRPYDLLEKFEDTLGGMIAWPCHLAESDEDFY